MDFEYPPQADTYRTKVRSFLDANLPKDWKGIGALNHAAAAEWTEDWRKKLYSEGFLAITWPKEYGGQGLSHIESLVLAEEFARAGVPAGGPNDGFGIGMLGNTIIAVGTEEQKRHYLPRALSGEDRWCQGYSEPAAGSDLGNLGCRAVLDGDEWVINGQKIWTSAGHLANYIFVLARTSPDDVKHRGITFLLVDMRQKGVEVRPIKMMSGDSEFNEVFFTDARIPRDWVIGEVNDGWRAATGLLAHERSSLGRVGADEKREASGSAAIPFHYLFDLAMDTNQNSDALLRQDLARAYTGEKLMGWLGQRSVHPSVGKLWRTQQSRFVASLAARMAMSGGAAHLPGDKDSEFWMYHILNSPRMSLGGGTDEIQKNTIGERALGLPREPS